MSTRAAKRALTGITQILACPRCDEVKSHYKICSCGMTVCAECVANLSICYYCQRPSPTVDNIMANSMGKKLTKICPNTRDGCRFTGNEFHLSEHLEICEYRDITCPLNEVCGKFRCTEFRKHLETHHNAQVTELKTSEKEIIFVIPRKPEQQFFAGRPVILRFEQKAFLGYAFVANGYAVMKFFIIGSKSSGAKYAGRVTLNPGKVNRYSASKAMESAADVCLTPQAHIDSYPYERCMAIEFLPEYARNFTNDEIEVKIRFEILRVIKK